MHKEVQADPMESEVIPQLKSKYNKVSTNLFKTFWLQVIPPPSPIHYIPKHSQWNILFECCLHEIFGSNIIVNELNASNNF